MKWKIFFVTFLIVSVNSSVINRSDDEKIDISAGKAPEEEISEDYDGTKQY